MLLNNLLIGHAHRQPAKTAVITHERSITYGELDLAVNCMARHLVGRGLQRDERVAVHWHNSIEHVVLMMAILRAGMVVVPINPRLKAAEIDYVLEHSGARLCFSEPALAGVVKDTGWLMREPSGMVRVVLPEAITAPVGLSSRALQAKSTAVPVKSSLKTVTVRSTLVLPA